MEKTVKIRNRSGSKVIYSIKEDNIRREFAPLESKTVPVEELVKLIYQPGGKRLIQDYLQILDKKVLSRLQLKVEPEYNYSEKEIKDLMLNGSSAEFEDCLEFAPNGVKDIIKTLAVELPLTNTIKRDLILKWLKFDVSAALTHLEEDRREELERNNKGKDNTTGETASEERTSRPRRRVINDK